MRSVKQLVILAFSIAAIVLGVYMTFFNDKMNPEKEMNVEESRNIDQEKNAEESEQVEATNDFDYTKKTLPLVENESEDETYNNGKLGIDIYFSNTDKLDQGTMPMEAQAVLCEEVQRYLIHSGYDDVTELYIDDESYIEDPEKISFVCFMDGHEETLQIEYWYKEQTLKYFILNSDEYREGGEDAEE